MVDTDEIGSGTAPLSESASRGMHVARVEARLPDPTGAEKSRIDDEKLLKQARKHFRYSLNSKAEREWRDKADKELKFVAGEHFTAEEKQERLGLPCLVQDRITPSIDQVVNDARQSPPEAKFSPVGMGADTPTAEAIQGISRNISNDSDGPVAILTGYEHAVQIGRGWIELKSVYDDPMSFKASLKIGRIGNPFCIYPDPDCSDFEYSDGMFSTKIIPFSRESFKKKWPHATANSFVLSEDGQDDTLKDWFGDGEIRVAEYWWVEMEDTTIYLLADGRVVDKSELYEAEPQAQRKSSKRVVRGALITGTDVLDRWDWPDTEIPHIPIIGREYIEDKIRKFRGMIRDAMDSNKRYDYFISKQTEAVGLAPKSQWVMAEGQDEGHEAEWASANRKPIAVLKYKILDADGKPIGPPQRIQPDVSISAINQALATAGEDTKQSLSTWGTSLGQPTSESSGRAILARQREADNVHFHYHDNLGRAVGRLGKMILRLIPFYFDEAEMLMVADPDGAMRQIQINQEYTDADGVKQFHALGAEKIGKYHVTVSSAPSYASRRAQAAADLMTLAQHMPGPMARALDIVVRTLDVPFAPELAKRLTPPDVVAAQEGPSREQLTQNIQQMQGQIAELTNNLKMATDSVERERMKLASQERNVDVEAKVQLAVAAIKAEYEAAKTEFNNQIQLLSEHLARIADPALAPATPAGAPSSPAPAA